MLGLRAPALLTLSLGFGLALAGCPSSDDGESEATGEETTSASSTSDASGDGDGDGNGDGDSEGDSDSTTMGDGDGDGDFVLTSDDFEQDGIIPTAHHFQGGNLSPALSWVGAPADTASFGVYFHDLDFQPQGYPYRHSAIWNISADTDALPQGVEMAAAPADVPGAVQCRNWFGGVRLRRSWIPEQHLRVHPLRPGRRRPQRGRQRVGPRRGQGRPRRARPRHRDDLGPDRGPALRPLRPEALRP